MQFTDLIFLFAFLPLTILVSFLEKSTEYKNFILIISSLLFFTWGEHFAIAIILLTFIFDWSMGLLCSPEKSRAVRITALIFDAILNLSVFLVFERNTLFDGIESLSFLQKLAHISVAFYCVRGFSYVFDVFTKKVQAEKNPFCIMTYMISFPLMAAGPVVRYGDIKDQIKHREITGRKINDGLTRLISGLGKLAILVPALERVELAGLNPDEITVFGSFAGMLAYMLKVCCLFAGTCDMAIGMGRLLGFEYPESFKMFSFRGYVTDLTRSFNFTLWELGEDVFVKPLRSRSRILSFVGMLLCGALIGAFYSGSLMFILAGAVVMLFVILEELFLKKLFDSIMPVFTWIYTAAVITLVFALTRFEGFCALSDWALGLVGRGEDYLLSVALKRAVTENAFILAAAALLYLPFSRDFFKAKLTKLCSKSTAAYGTFRILQTAALCLMLILSIVNLSYSVIS